MSHVTVESPFIRNWRKDINLGRNHSTEITWHVSYLTLIHVNVYKFTEKYKRKLLGMNITDEM